MIDVLPDRLAWYIAGPALGLLVVLMFAVTNQPLGASGAYVQTAAFVRRQAGAVAWRVWYFVGIFAGGLLVTLLRDSPGLRSGYGALRDVWPLGVVIPVVFVGAVVMGYGARMAGGCTSGHGICGTAQRSPASFTVTATFMATAIAVTAVLHVLTGGQL
jgi:uncharacterized protein